jgi:hypothetical protein
MRVTELLTRVGCNSDRRRMQRAIVYIARTWPRLRHFQEEHLKQLEGELCKPS